MRSSVIIVVSLALLLAGGSALWLLYPQPELSPLASVAPFVEPTGEAQSVQRLPNINPRPESALRPADDEASGSVAVDSGASVDPDDPSTWPVSESTEVVDIGEPMDPEDPSTWPQSESTEVVDIGEPMDPEDPSTWPQSENTQVVDIGEPMDPDDPLSWPQPETTEVMDVGDSVDPVDPPTWDEP